MIFIDFGGPEWLQKYDQHSNDHETESGKGVADNIFYCSSINYVQHQNSTKKINSSKPSAITSFRFSAILVVTLECINKRT